MDFCSQHLPQDLRQQRVLHDSYQEPDSAEMRGSGWSGPLDRFKISSSGQRQVDGKGKEDSVLLTFEFINRRSADVAWIQAELISGTLNLSTLLSSNQGQPEPAEQVTSRSLVAPFDRECGDA